MSTLKTQRDFAGNLINRSNNQGEREAHMFLY